MSRLTDDEAFLARYYSGDIFQVESDRLEKHCPVEFGVTRRCLERFVPAGALVADVGVGVGHDAALLARKGGRIHLVDIAPRLLQAAGDRLSPAAREGWLDLVAATATTPEGLGQSDHLLFVGRKR